MPIETSMYSTTPDVKLDPAAALSAAQGMQNLQASQYDLRTKQLGQVRMALGSLAQDPNVTPEKVQAAGMQLVQQGIIQPGQLQTFMGGIQGLTGENLRGALANHLATAIEPAYNYTQAYGGTPGQANAGDKEILFRQGVRTGITPVGEVQSGVSPQVTSTPVDAPDGPQGQKRTESFGARAAANGIRVPTGSMSGPGINGGNNLTGRPATAAPPNALNVPPPVAPAGPGAQMPRAVSAAAPATPVVAAAAAPAVAPQATAAAPAVVEPRVMTNAAGSIPAQTMMAEDSAKQFTALRAASQAAVDTKATIQEMERHLEGFTPGLVSDAVGKVGNIVKSTTGIDLPFTGVADKEQFDKLSARLQQQNAALGVSSDSGLANANAMTPNSRYTKESLEGMLAQAKGNQDAIRIKQDMANEWMKKPGNGPDKYGEFLADFNQKFDPRVFQLPYMKPAERQKLMDNLTPSEHAKVVAAGAEAIKRGWIKPQGQ